MESNVTTAPIIPAGTSLAHDTLILHDVIGSGSYGHIYLGQRTQPTSDTANTPAFVAVKTIPKADLSSSQIDLLRIEFDLQRTLAPHVNIVTAHDLLEDDDHVYMVMELCEGGDLFDLIAREQHVGPSGAAGIRDQELVASIFRDIVHAVAHAHLRHGIYHRDIKPENVVATGDGLRWKLADFGLATRDRESFEHETGSSVYIAPEQFTLGEQGLPYKTGPADVWSLGVLLLAMIVGRHPWNEANQADSAFVEFTRRPESLRDSFPGLSDGAWALLSRMLDVDPIARISIQDLEHLVNSHDPLGPFLTTVTPPQIPRSPPRQSSPSSSAPLAIPHHPNPAVKRDSFDSGIGSWADLADHELDFDADPFAASSQRGSGSEVFFGGIEQRLEDADEYLFVMEI